MSATVPGNDGVSVLRPPREIVAAVRLMYLGAALTALLGVLRAIDPDAYTDSLDTTSGNSQWGSYVLYLFVVAGVWLLVARYCRRGSRQARRAATFFAALYLVAVVVTVVNEPRFDAYNVVSVVIAAVAAAVVWLLYQPEARAWFTPSGPPTS